MELLINAGIKISHVSQGRLPWLVLLVKPLSHIQKDTLRMRGPVMIWWRNGRQGQHPYGGVVELSTRCVGWEFTRQRRHAGRFNVQTLTPRIRAVVIQYPENHVRQKVILARIIPQSRTVMQMIQVWRSLWQESSGQQHHDGRHSADDLTGVHRTLGVSSSTYMYVYVCVSQYVSDDLQRRYCNGSIPLSKLLYNHFHYSYTVANRIHWYAVCLWPYEYFIALHKVAFIYGCHASN